MNIFYIPFLIFSKDHVCQPIAQTFGQWIFKCGWGTILEIEKCEIRYLRLKEPSDAVTFWKFLIGFKYL